MWVVGETSTPETLPFKVGGGKHILTVLPWPPQSCWFQNWTKSHANCKRFAWRSLEKMNPRNLNHLMSNDLEKIANFCVSFSCLWEEMEWGRGTLQSLLSPLSFLLVAAPQPKCDTFYHHLGGIWGCIVFTPFFMCMLICVERWIESSDSEIK